MRLTIKGFAENFGLELARVFINKLIVKGLNSKSNKIAIVKKLRTIAVNQ